MKNVKKNEKCKKEKNVIKKCEKCKKCKKCKECKKGVKSFKSEKRVKSVKSKKISIRRTHPTVSDQCGQHEGVLRYIFASFWTRQVLQTHLSNDNNTKLTSQCEKMKRTAQSNSRLFHVHTPSEQNSHHDIVGTSRSPIVTLEGITTLTMPQHQAITYLSLLWELLSTLLLFPVLAALALVLGESTT